MDNADLIQLVREEIAALEAKRAAVADDPDLASIIDQKVAKLQEKLAQFGFVPPPPEPSAPPAEGKRPAGTTSLASVRAEVARLEGLKAQSLDDPASLKLIQNRLTPLLEELRALGASAPADPVEEELPEIPLPSPEQLEKAERLIQTSQLERRRGNEQRAHELLLEAQAAAPGSPLVLETLADALMEARRFTEARDIYSQALRASRGAKNAGLENKHAQAVLRTSSVASVDDMLRMSLSDSPFLNPEDQVARANYATLYNVFVPGVGQIVLGRTVTGILILAAWLFCVIWVIVLRDDLSKLFRAFAGAGGGASGNVVFPIVLGVAIHLGAILNTLSLAKTRTPVVKGDRPRPPVDLPFE